MVATEEKTEQKADFYAGLARNDAPYDVDGETVRRERDGARWENYTRMTVVRRAEKIDRLEEKKREEAGR